MHNVEADIGRLRADTEQCRQLGHITLGSYLSSFKAMYPHSEIPWTPKRIAINSPRMAQLGVEQWKYARAMSDEVFREKELIVLVYDRRMYMKVGNARMKAKFDLGHRMANAFVLVPNFHDYSREEAFAANLERQVEEFKLHPNNLRRSDKIDGMWILPGTNEPREVDITERL